MKTLIFVGIITLFISCKKAPPVVPNVNANNQVNATVILSSGTIVNIKATSSKAIMGCSLGGTYLAGTSESNAAVYINIYDTVLMCVNTAGTYNFRCEYRPNVASPSTPIYINSGIGNRGSITFTTLDLIDQYAEGYFNAVCYYEPFNYLPDSVFVQGTFKGYYKN